MDSFWWFIAAACVCGFHAAFLLDWRRENRERLRLYSEYEKASQKRHDEFMDALTFYRRGSLGWSNKRGQA